MQGCTLRLDNGQSSREGLLQIEICLQPPQQQLLSRIQPLVCLARLLENMHALHLMCAMTIQSKCTDIVCSRKLKDAAHDAAGLK